MAWQRFEIDVPDGMRLGEATDSEGGLRGMLFDERTNRLVTFARLFPAHDGPAERPRRAGPQPLRWTAESPNFREQLARAVLEPPLEALHELAVRKGEDAGQWIHDKTLAGFDSLKAKLQTLRSASSHASGAATVTPRQPKHGSDSGASETMTSAEAMERFDEAVLAAAYAGEQLRRLQKAVIVDEDGQPRVAAAGKHFAPDNVVEAILSALEKSPPMLEAGLASFEERLLAARLAAQPTSLTLEQQAQLERPNNRPT